MTKRLISTRNHEIVERYQAKSFLFCFFKLQVTRGFQIPSPSRLEFGLCSSKLGRDLREAPSRVASCSESWSWLLAAQPCRFFVPASIESPSSIYSMQFPNTTRGPTNNRRLKGKYANAAKLLNSGVLE